MPGQGFEFLISGGVVTPQLNRSGFFHAPAGDLGNRFISICGKADKKRNNIGDYDY
jgi:hypothetical protein